MKKLLSTELHGETKIFGSDAGTEFLNKQMDDLLERLQIRRQTACPDDQSQNGLAERAIGVLFEMVRTLIHDAKLPLSFWGEVLVAANYLRNRLPTCANPNNASPYELRYGKLPNLRFLRPIGDHCTVLKHSRNINGAKAKTRGLKGIMVGYGEPFGLKGYRVYIPALKKVVTAPNVLFLDSMEDSIAKRLGNLILLKDPSILDPFAEPTTQPGANGDLKLDPDTAADTDATTVADHTVQSENPANQRPPIRGARLDEPAEPIQNDPRQLRHEDENGGVVSSNGHGSTSEGDTESDGDSREPHLYTEAEATRTPKKGYQYLPETHPFFRKPGIFDTRELDALRSDGPPASRTRNKLREGYINTMESFTKAFRTNAFLYLAENPFAADIELPSSYTDALQSEHSESWRAALAAEIASLKKLKVFKVIKQKHLPPGANIISGKWVFKVKPRQDGSIEKFKCRLCARGFLQKHGVDYTSTFSPVANQASIKLLLAIAQKWRLHLRSADVSTAFLFGSLPSEERVYMKPPSGIKTNPGEILELHRCIYGLKQASRRWYEKLRQTLEAAGYKATRADPCVYTRNSGGEYTMIATVVDDLLIASTTAEGGKRVSQIMNEAKLDTKDLGTPEYIIGMHVGRTPDSITLNQSLYIKTLLRRFEMEDCHPCDTPANPSVRLGKAHFPANEAQRKEMETKPYRALVGGLLYVVLTRPDIAVAVNELCRHLTNPGKAMWTAAKRVLRYLKATAHYKIKFLSKVEHTGNNLLGYVDSSHADDLDTRRSRCGFLVYFDQSPISWKTALQKRRALSTAEAEYRAATLVTKEIVWLRRLLGELGLPQTKPTQLYEDNAACVKMIMNPMVSHRNKHIELDAHFVRDHYELGSITPTPISTQHQKADLLTKNLGRTLFERHTFSIMDIRCASEGDCQFKV
jgi:hypothetical protein